jgi:hypothetical protein
MKENKIKTTEQIELENDLFFNKFCICWEHTRNDAELIIENLVAITSTISSMKKLQMKNDILKRYPELASMFDDN